MWKKKFVKNKEEKRVNSMDGQTDTVSYNSVII